MGRPAGKGLTPRGSKHSRPEGQGGGRASCRESPAWRPGPAPVESRGINRDSVAQCPTAGSASKVGSPAVGPQFAGLRARRDAPVPGLTKQQPSGSLRVRFRGARSPPGNGHRTPVPRHKPAMISATACRGADRALSRRIPQSACCVRPMSQACGVTGVMLADLSSPPRPSGGWRRRDPVTRSARRRPAAARSVGSSRHPRRLPAAFGSEVSWTGCRPRTRQACPCGRSGSWCR